MVIPWTGFPLRKILSLVNPLPNATYVKFESSALPSAMKDVKSFPNGLYTGVTWPYVEGLSIDEAWNDLAFVSVGQYNSVLLPQSGAPIRLTVSPQAGLELYCLAV
jgi:sulfoxide reductase catalytic subunit YedY